MKASMYVTVLGSGLALGLAGCNLAPHYTRPAAGVPGQFKEAQAAPSSAPGQAQSTPSNPEAGNGPAQEGQPASAMGWKVATPQDDRLGGNWWELYNDPDLDALEARVAAANQNIAAAAANYRQARALVAEARSALFPTLAISPSITRSRASASNSGGGFAEGGGTGAGTAGGQAGQTRTFYSLPADASYELDLWGRVRNSVAQSEFSAEATAADLATAVLSAQATLAQDYFELRSVDQQRRILDTTLADYQASLQLVYTLFHSGLASEEDIATANTQLDSAQAQATDLGVARAQYEHAIAVLIGVPPSEFSVPVKTFAPQIPDIPLALPSELLERRPDISAAERRVAAANAAIGIARAAWFPTVGLSGSLGYDSLSFSQWLDWPNRFWSVGPTVAETIFDGGLRRAQNAAARAAFDQSVAAYRQTVLSAFQSVEDDLVTLRVLSQEIVQQHAAAEAARREVELSVTRYKAGIDSYVNVITAQNAFLTARLAELQVQLRQVTASIALVNNVGGGWDFSQLSATERLGMHPPRVEGAAPGESAEGVVNPPALPGPPAKPEEMLQQDEADMAPTPPPVRR